MERFDEFSDEAQVLIAWFESSLELGRGLYNITYKDPIHDIARRFLNEIVEFEAMEEEKRSSLKPWEKV